MNTKNTFTRNPIQAGYSWIGKCIALALIVSFGWYTDLLQEVCIGVIVGFVSIQGLWPFFRWGWSFVADVHKCRIEKDDLQHIDSGLASDVAAADQSNAGSVHKLIAGIQQHQDRMSKGEAAELMLNVAKEHWEGQLAPINTAAEQTPVLGLGGSLLGMLSGISVLGHALAGGDPAAVQPAFSEMMGGMATMVSTTLAGCFGALVLLGLSAIASNAVDRHLAELRLIAELMDSANPNYGDEQENQYFHKGA